MRYAFIADVHANVEALTAVLGAIAEIGVDSVLCLGDVVGRFADPNAVVDILRKRRIRTVAGNHDLAAVGLADDRGWTARAKRSVVWTKAALTVENARFLLALPLTRTIDDCFLMVHAALHPRPNVEVYLTTSAETSRSLSMLRQGGHRVRLAFFGHTHRAGVHRMWTESGAVASSTSAVQKLAPDSVYLVNPGSVGQPRDGDIRASFATYDSDHALVRLHRVAFDYRAANMKARKAGLIAGGEEYLP